MVAVPGASNAADLGTKILQGARMVALCAAMGLRPRTVTVAGAKDAKALVSFAVLMASLAPVVVEGTTAVAPRDGGAAPPAIILGDAAVELSARGIMISWRALLHFLLFLLPLLLWAWRARRAGPRLAEGLESSEART